MAIQLAVKPRRIGPRRSAYYSPSRSKRDTLMRKIEALKNIQRFQDGRETWRSAARCGQAAEQGHPGSPLKQLVSPLLDLVRGNVELLRQLDQGLLALDRRDHHFRLECRAVFPAWSSCNGLLLARSITLLLRRKSTYPGCSDFRGHP